MKDYVVISATTTFTQKYVIPLDETHNIEHARHLVTEEQVKEFSQHFEGEVITGTDIISEEQLFDLYKTENPHLDSWTDEKKIEYANNYKETWSNK